jgi:catechol 2,3-dioxygenase-like lactoylglutathione lyase family enzyme
MSNTNGNAKTSSKLFPLVMTKKLDKVRAFYTEKLGCSLKHDLPDYLQVAFRAADGPELCFMIPDNAPSLGAAPDEFAGRGLAVSVPVDDVDGLHAKLAAKGVPIVSAPTDRPWKWRSFVCQDPSGVLLDFFKPLEQM